ncbi:acyl-CoA dehydrogenase family protein, partial [Streptomyces sp. NRRL B-24484]
MSNSFDLFRTAEEHDMLRDAVRSLAEAKIAPFAAEVDEQGRFP